MSESPMANDGTGIPCEGWWEQAGFGRQTMENLRLRFEAGQIIGSGPFSFAGTISDNGQVAMVKRNFGRHTVDYLGTYDGEGQLWGEWRIGSMLGRWAIKIKGSPGVYAQALEVEAGACPE